MKPLEKIVLPLLSWYEKEKRILPWRENHDPYRIFVSEMMLQQTRVETAIAYFNRFIKQIPTIYDLKEMEEDRLLKLWEGLGYYNRVRNMQKMAKIVVEQYDGKIPDSYDEITKLPGIGPYTAGAILSIAYQKKIACVDGNVLRVITRYLKDDSNIDEDATKKKIKNLLEEVLPEEVGDFNQSLMELGALICLPNGAPKCFLCPLHKECKAYLDGAVNEIPVRKKKMERKKESYTVFLIRYQNSYQIEKRQDTGLLASMYQFPNKKGKRKKKEIMELFPKEKILKVEKLPMVKHIFSHIEWEMFPYLIEVKEKIGPLFATEEELEKKYSLPTAMQKILKQKDKH